MHFKKTKFSNGLTLITAPMKDSVSVTVLVMVHTGSKYESKDENGLSHFLEHMCFKGTTKRPKSSMISLELDRIGSQNNAFTSHEFTGYYAKSHPKHLATILDVVSDVYQHPVFDPVEIEKEKGVIIEEMHMYEDIPQRVVHDVFMDALYGDQPAGWKVIGTKENVMRISQKDFLEYRTKHYVADATTVIVAGDFDEASIIPIVEKTFSSVPSSSKHSKVKVVEKQDAPILRIKHKETDQTHIILGVRTFDSYDKRNNALRVLSTVLGGGMSSRLFQKLREEMGVGYYVGSGVDEFTDHGYLAVSMGVDRNRVAEVIPVTLSLLSELATTLVPGEELSKAKEYMVGHTYLGLESSDAVAEYYAIQDILSHEILTPKELAEKIQKVTAEDVQKVAQDIMKNNGLVMAIVGNIQDPEKIKEDFHF